MNNTVYIINESDCNIDWNTGFVTIKKGANVAHGEIEDLPNPSQKKFNPKEFEITSMDKVVSAFESDHEYRILMAALRGKIKGTCKTMIFKGCRDLGLDYGSAASAILAYIEHLEAKISGLKTVEILPDGSAKIKLGSNE